jgi:hypothetical protein
MVVIIDAFTLHQLTLLLEAGHAIKEKKGRAILFLGVVK